MKAPYKLKNNFAFIDSQNLNLGIRDQGWKLDFQRFRKFLKNKFHISKAYIFIGYMKENERLYDHLTKVGYIIIHKPTLELYGGKVKGNCDAELVLHTMIEYENYDKAIIVSGDGDFHCLIEYLYNKNKLKKIIIPNRKKYSRLLKRFSKDLVYMNSMKKDFSK